MSRLGVTPKAMIAPCSSITCNIGNDGDTNESKPRSDSARSLHIPSSLTQPSATEQKASRRPWTLTPARLSTRATLVTDATPMLCSGVSSSLSLTQQYMPTVATSTSATVGSTYSSTVSHGVQEGGRDHGGHGANAVDGTLSLTVRPAGWTLQTFGPSIQRLGAGTGGCVDLHCAKGTSKVVAIKTLQSKPQGHASSRALEEDKAADDSSTSTSTRNSSTSGSTSSSSSVLNRRILEELGIAVNVRHQNIIRTHEVIVETDRTCYVVMEACAVDLLALIQGHHHQKTAVDSSSNSMLSNSSSAVDGYFVQLVRGVQYLHSIGVGHRDLKLDNICVTEQGVLKIVDFGCATLFRRRVQQQPAAASGHGYTAAASSFWHAQSAKSHYALSKATKARATPYTIPSLAQQQPLQLNSRHQYVETLSYGICGSDPYMAPELFAGSYYMAPKVDIWALGIIYFAMRHQQFPWAVAQASRDARYRAFTKSSEAFVNMWFSTESRDNNGGTASESKGSVGGWSLVPSSPGVNFLNITQKKCHPADTAPVSNPNCKNVSAKRIIRRMLESDPASRADISEIINDPWFQSLSDQTKHA
ncbi:Nitrogen permease reactivator protein [Coemansia sp. RSA 1358]|nr:Nitrogen permease reactivator protein [Coemansia umbellata]KAJ2619639.1 Nitrogen permease reactivator protein [Coemansia sp. RSA 1358]